MWEENRSRVRNRNFWVVTASSLQKAIKNTEFSQFRKQAAIQVLPPELFLEPQTILTFYIVCLTLNINNSFALTFEENIEY